MFFDLNVPIEAVHSSAPPTSKKAKGKAAQQGPQAPQQGSQPYTQAQISAIESRIDLLVHLGYTVLAFSQTIHKKFDPKTHANVLDALVPLLRPRPRILYLKRLNIILDEDSEKGFGLINAHTNFFSSYDLLSLTPTSLASFSLACLTHTLPSPLTTHIISLPLTLPRLGFHLKHTLVRTALKNGAAFEICYVGSLGGQQDPVLTDAGYAESGASAKKNWWAATREVVRVTKGKGIIVTGGAINRPDLRAPKDVVNLIALLGVPQDAAHHALTSTPKSITIRAQTRRTYRTVLSEPKVVIPEGSMDLIRASMQISAAEAEAEVGTSKEAVDVPAPALPALPAGPFAATVPQDRAEDDGDDVVQVGMKRALEQGDDSLGAPVSLQDIGAGMAEQERQEEGQGSGSYQKQDGKGPTKKKKRKKNNKPLESFVS